MPRTWLVELSLTFSSLIRHQRLLALRCFFLSLAKSAGVGGCPRIALFNGVEDREGKGVAGFAVLADGDAGGVASRRGTDVGPGCMFGLGADLFGRRRLDREEREDSDDDDGESRRGELIEGVDGSGSRVKDDDCSGLSLAELRLWPDRCGLGTTEAAGVPRLLYIPDVPKEAGVEMGAATICRRYVS